MSQTCSICGRGTATGFNVSHSKVKTKRKQKINLKSKKIGGRKIKICTNCLKTMSKKAAK
ncbi:MAG: 50S ribosomal protein L28 [Patescibacteria group bacterium]